VCVCVCVCVCVVFAAVQKRGTLKERLHTNNIVIEDIIMMEHNSTYV
jgi:hypothetical protein